MGFFGWRWSRTDGTNQDESGGSPPEFQTPSRFTARHANRRMPGRTGRVAPMAARLAVLALAALPLYASADTSSIESGYSAMWYDPARDGEGWVLEILPEDRALLYWFTYDEAGDQRWLQAVGEILRGESGDAIEFPELYVTRGPRFGPGFDPGDVEFDVVGEAAMTFEDCDRGQFSYSAFGQTQTMDIQRLSQTMAAGCEPINGVPGEPAKAYAGQSGSWYDESHNGEGYALHWLSRDEALLTWYSYDADGEQYWLIGLGEYQDGQIVFENLQSTRGARFGEDFDPDDVEYIDWGSLVIELECAEGTASYESDLPAFGAGEFELTRLTKLERPDCPYVRPKLQDLYEITWNEIPIEPGTHIRAASIANDGTIAAALGLADAEGGSNLALWRPESREWETFSRRILRNPIEISGDAGTVAASDNVKDLGEPMFPLRWTSELGWRRLPNRVFDRSWITGESHNFSHFAGMGHDIGDARRYPWIWNASLGQRELPISDEHRLPTPLMVANDGEAVVGISIRPIGGTSLPPKRFAVRWKGNNKPQTIRDSFGASLATASRCNRDCSIIFGFGQTEFDPEHPHVGEAWIKVRNRDVQYLGRLPDTEELRAISYSVSGSTPDGSLVSGSYDADGTDSRGWIWTQRTGIVSVRTLAEELGIGHDDWRTMSAGNISPDGRRVLLSGWAPLPPPGVPSQRRAVVLELEPKERLE